jgi:diguanylate cyclase (GGDEF)-like protein
MTFTRLGAAEGLSQGAIRSIAQDAEGFMWFGTEDGLDRYDGYELRHFIHSRREPGSLPNNWIAALTRDASGRLWVGSDGGGVVWRDAELGRFRAMEAGPAAQPESISQVRALHFDRGGRLWVATRGAGLHVIDTARHQAVAYRHDPANEDSLSSDSVYAMAEDLSGAVWIGTAAGLDRLNQTTGRFEHFAARIAGTGSAPPTPIQVNALYTDSHGALWIALEAGLARMDTATAVITVLRHRAGDTTSLPEGRVTALLEDDEQRFWVGTSQGLVLLDRRNDQCVVMRHDQTSPDSLPDSNISSLYQDRGGLLWIGTKAGGIARWNPRSWSFGHHRFTQEAADNVTSFAVDGTGKLWVGSFGAGVASVDPLSGAVTRYRQGRGSVPALRDDTVMAMVVDERNRVWLGTMSHGVERLDPVRHAVKHFANTPADAASLPAPGVMSLLRDSRGRVWVGTYGGGIAMIDPGTDRVVRFEHGAATPASLSSDRATALAEDRTGLIWIGTDGGGLNVLDPATGRFAHYLHDPRDTSSLAADIVYAVHMDEQGVMWVGMRGGGIDRVEGTPFSKDGLRFVNLSEAEGLPNSTVYGIESDNSGRLWVSTNLGLASVRTADRVVHGFRRNHGLQADEFNFGAHYRAADGAVFFGGNNGYNAFVPERLRFSEKPPPVVLTDVYVLNTRATDAPESMRKLHLGFRDAVVTFQFAALDFAGPADNRYLYRLDGFDTDWVDAGTAHKATYTHLDGGDYTFRVRAANNDGRWSETPLSLHLQVEPPPWATWWARTLYAAALCILAFLIWRAQRRRVQREAAYARRLQREVDERTAELAERNAEMERVNRQLREVSVTDSLTGLGNRRFLHEAMDTLAGDAADGGCVLMVVDLDHLKPINDKYGHEGGDAVLIQVAEILRRELRAGDLIVRWGGDEFVIVCRDSDLVTAGVLADRIRASVAKRLFRVGDGLMARTSCSIGFARAPFFPGTAPRLNWQQSLGIADLALYEAKRDRNSWVGWAGTEKAEHLASLLTDLAASPATLELDGYLTVCRRPWNPDETVDRLRAPRLPTPR